MHFKSKRRELQRRNELDKNPRHRKMSGPALKAARNRKRALLAKYA